MLSPELRVDLKKLSIKSPDFLLLEVGRSDVGINMGMNPRMNPRMNLRMNVRIASQK
jgi:hypothetical protein